jgi:AcrR family transcriptional regulator
LSGWITPPSLYAAFGGKEELFRRAVDRYVAWPARHLADALMRPAAREVAEDLLRGMTDRQAHHRLHRGWASAC